MIIDGGSTLTVNQNSLGTKSLNILTSGTINMKDNAYSSISVGDLTAARGSTIIFDVDLTNATKNNDVDNPLASTYFDTVNATSATGTLTLKEVNVTKGMAESVEVGDTAYMQVINVTGDNTIVFEGNAITA